MSQYFCPTLSINDKRTNREQIEEGVKKFFQNRHFRAYFNARKLSGSTKIPICQFSALRAAKSLYLSPAPTGVLVTLKEQLILDKIAHRVPASTNLLKYITPKWGHASQLHFSQWIIYAVKVRNTHAPECHIFPRRLKLYCEHSSLGSHQARCNNHFFDIDCIARGAQMIAQSTSWFLADDHPLPSVLEFFFRVYNPPFNLSGTV